MTAAPHSLFWISRDKTARWHGGDFASLADAWSSIPLVKGDLLDQCLLETDRADIEAGDWIAIPMEKQA